jgi:NAD(P)-dependent dehydrogenase (short-subunit alcohol dehydrogenase family)/acyl carrier protein
MTLTRHIPGALDRIENQAQYQRWLADLAGYDRAEIEVVKRVLRIVDQGAPIRQPAPSNWRAGTGPTLRATAPGDGYKIDYRPAPVIAPATVRPMVVPAPEPVVVSIETPESLPRQDARGREQEARGTEQETKIENPRSEIEDVVKTRVLALVSEKTGYPPDLLDLDLDLEADLGVDTVKQAETFAAIRSAFDIPRRDDLKLRDYPTLNHVIKFVYEMRPDLKGSGIRGQELRQAEHEARGTEQEATIETPKPEAAVDSVQEQILKIVAEKTGYPTDLLDLDLDLEADLGVDTVKQAETFAAIRAKFDIPRRDDLKLRDYPTLSHVIQFVYEMRPDLKGSGIGEQGLRQEEQEARGNEARAEITNQKHLHRAADAVQVSAIRNLEDADRVPRRVPVPALRPALEFCKPTSVTLDANSRVIVMTDQGNVGQALVDRLHARGATTLVLETAVSTEALVTQISAWVSEGSIQGVYWLPALDVEPALGDLTLDLWREHNRVRVKNLYAAIRVVYDAVSTPGTFLVSATRLGGLHGYGDDGATAPLGGAVVGFAKAYKREQPNVLVKAVDFEIEPTVDPAEVLIDETLSDPGVVEVGYHHGRRFTIMLEERSAVDGQAGLTLNHDRVFVATGAAGSITSEIVADLAAASSGVFYLLDLVPAPEGNAANIKLFRTDQDGLKQKLIEEMKTAGEKPTPVKIDKQLFAIERSEAALRAMEAVTAAGGRPLYYSVNLLDAHAIAQVVDDIRQRHGRIDVLLHAGGVEISRSLPDKEPEEFDLVFDVKTEGFFNILHAAKDMPIGAIVSFSSVAGRFGNAGQTDYSAANDLLCKLTSSLRRTWPETRSIAIDWTAWGSIGMATRGSIPKIMEMAGIDTLPPAVGIPTIRRELTCGGTRGEVVVAGRLGIMTNEFDETGGLDVARINHALSQRDRPLLMIGEVKTAKLHGGLEVETTLDPNVQPFLFDHQLEDTPLLPGVMGTEMLAELASVLAPDYTVAEVFNERFESPFKFYRRQPRTLYLQATIQLSSHGDLIAHTRLRSITPAPKPELPAQEKVHFTADVRLTCRVKPQPAIAFDAPPVESMPIGHQAIYRVFFHGPAYQVIERARVEGDRATGLISAELPPNTSPANAASIMAPRLIEACFQTVGVWQIEAQHVMALPLSIGSVAAYRQPGEVQGRLYAVATAINHGESFDAQVVDERGAVLVDLKGYRTITLPGTVRF